MPSGNYKKNTTAGSFSSSTSLIDLTKQLEHALGVRMQDVDAVCIAVPTRLHHQVGMDCLKAGIHTLILTLLASNILPVSEQKK